MIFNRLFLFNILKLFLHYIDVKVIDPGPIASAVQEAPQSSEVTTEVEDVGEDLEADVGTGFIPSRPLVSGENIKRFLRLLIMTRRLCIALP